MNLHEYQAKNLMRQYGIAVPTFALVHNPNEVADVCERLAGPPWAAKVQVHSGGRGKSGGVKLVKSVDEAREFAEGFIGQRFVGYQTDAAGQPIDCIIVEECAAIARELYLSLLVDRASLQVTVVASSQGGMDIETVAREQPDEIHKQSIHPLVGLLGWQVRELGAALELDKEQTKQFGVLLGKLLEAFVERDFSLVEINPLVVTEEGNLMALDAKINVDDNALARQSELAAMHDLRQLDERELVAIKWDLNYIPLTGNIGCMVNGAGLAMATMDLIKLHGGDPANFLDVGGSATSERVREAFKLILADESVKAVLVNIFGGIVRCDLIAQGIIKALGEIEVIVPVVVRLEGTNAEEAYKILGDSDIKISIAKSLDEAARMATGALDGQDSGA